MPIIHVCGAPGSGKTTLARALARDLELPMASVDEERRKLLRPGQSWPSDDSKTWIALRAAVEANPALVLETMGGTRNSDALLEGRGALNVLVSAPDHTRLERIRARARRGDDPMIGRPDKYIAALARIPRPVVNADVEWNGTEPISGEKYDQLLSTLRESIAASKRSPLAMTATKAEWDSTYISNLPDSAFACIDGGGDKDEDGKTTPRSLRHYPHHKADGSVDLPHLRNALSRVSQEDTTTCGVSHLRAHAEEAEVGAKMAVKFAEGTDNIIEGLAVPFGGPFGGKDLDGEAFSPDTDLALEWFPEEGRPVIYHHGLDEGMKTALVGRQIAREVQDAGHWVKVQLDKRNRYFEQISQMVNDGLLSFSSGSLSHLVQIQDSQIKAWPWVELSLTPTPANPDAAVYAVKASDAIEHIAAVKSIVPAPLKAAVDVMEDGFTEQTPGDPEPESLADRSERVSREVKAWVERLPARVDAREKEGRKALPDVAIAAVRETHQTLGELIERIDQPTADEAEAAAAVAEHLRLEAELLGIAPG